MGAESSSTAAPWDPMAAVSMVRTEVAFGRQPRYRHRDMIRTIRIRGFKRLGRETEFRLPGHVVLAGPNNTGKTTVLQAIASWSLALRRWRELNDFNPRQGYTYAPIARQAFSAVPLRSFDLMWTNRLYHRNNPIEIGASAQRRLVGNHGVHSPTAPSRYTYDPRRMRPRTCCAISIFVSCIHSPDDRNRDRRTSVSAAEDRTASRTRGVSGEVMRNLLVEANRDEPAWDELSKRRW